MWRHRKHPRSEPDEPVAVAISEPLDLNVLNMLWEPTDEQGRHPGARAHDSLALLTVASGSASFQALDQSLSRLTAKGLIHEDRNGLVHATERARDLLSNC